MKIEHELYGAQVRWGFIWWREEKDEEFRKVLPEEKFTMDVEGERISNRKVDWNLKRVSIGPKIMQKYFQEDDIITISKSPDGRTVVIKKKDGPEPEPDLPIVTKLRKTQRNSEDPALFEKALVEAFDTIGFSAEHIGGRDKPDIFINDNFNIILDSKTTKDGVITEGFINFDAMDRYKENYNADYIGVVAPGFSEGNIRETAEKKGLILIETEAICRILQNHKNYPYELNTIVDILFESGKSVITRKDIPSSTNVHKRLIEIVAKILSGIKFTGKTSFSSRELYIAFSWQGLNYEPDEIENALKFLSVAPFSILQKQNDEYSLTGDIEYILKKIGLLLQAFNKM